MSCPLIPERPILISPSLAATIGLQEATLLSVLHERSLSLPAVLRQGQNWYELPLSDLQTAVPFWSIEDIHRISHHMAQQGVLHLYPQAESSPHSLVYAFETHGQQQRTTTSIKAAPLAKKVAGYGVIPPNWQPDDEVLRRIAQHNIPESFMLEQVPEFITYWRDSGEKARSWGSRFHSHVVHQWRQRETFTARKEGESVMDQQWQPSRDAIEVLVRQAGINLQFVEDAVPEFVLYWQERGEKSRTWNSKFIQHTRRQWLRYTSALEHDTDPKRIPDDWRPNHDVMDVLAMANIDRDFALNLLPEFVLYWKDSNQLHASWNTKFLQHVKYHWAKRHAYPNAEGQHHEGLQTITQPTRTRDRSITQDLNDRSWAT